MQGALLQVALWEGDTTVPQTTWRTPHSQLSTIPVATSQNKAINYKAQLLNSRAACDWLAILSILFGPLVERPHFESVVAHVVAVFLFVRRRMSEGGLSALFRTTLLS